MTSEVWRSIEWLQSHYLISSEGRVKNPGTGRFLKFSTQKSGHKLVKLYSQGQHYSFKVHRLVAAAFCDMHGGPIVRHLNGNPADNRAANLAWGTRSENAYDRVTHGTHPLAGKTRCKRGHPFNESNTYIDPHGWRHRRQCTAATQKARHNAR